VHAAGTISFGLVSIPVSLGVATKRSDPKFRTLDAETLRPVRQQFVAPAPGEGEEAREQPVERAATVKGYEVEADRFVVVSEEELRGARAEQRRSIDITAFVDAAEVDPVYYDRSYYVKPQPGAERPYALLLQAMRETGRAAVGTLVLSTREHLALVRPSGDALVVELLFYPEDVRPRDEIERQVRDTEVRGRELEVATQLVENLSRPFDPQEFENERKRELMALIERKVAGDEVTAAPEPERPVPDLMRALEASLEQAKRPKRTQAKRARARRAASRSE
jgi:DNA end-binding protein Ku